MSDQDRSAGPDGRTTAPAQRPGRHVSRRVMLGGLAALAVGGAGAVGLGLRYVDTARSETASASGQLRAADSGQPVTEFAEHERGQPVELRGGTLTDVTLDLRDLRGRVVVVNVWGSWCGPCRVEAPVLARASRNYAEAGVAFVGVNVKDNRAAAVAFEQRYGITYPSIEDRDGRAVLALSRYVPASAVPVTLVLDRQGRVAARVLGAVREATLRALVDTVLAEPARRP